MSIRDKLSILEAREKEARQASGRRRLLRCQNTHVGRPSLPDTATVSPYRGPQLHTAFSDHKGPISSECVERETGGPTATVGCFKTPQSACPRMGHGSHYLYKWRYLPQQGAPELSLACASREGSGAPCWRPKDSNPAIAGRLGSGPRGVYYDRNCFARSELMAVDVARRSRNPGG